MDYDDSEGWETNLSSWKQRRKSQSKYQHVQDLLEETSDKAQKKPKTFREMVQTSETKSHNVQGFYEDNAENALPVGHMTSFSENNKYPVGGDRVPANHSKNMSSRGTLFTELNTDKDGENYASDKNKKFCEKIIKISQRPNNEKGFGFTVTGGREFSLPITVEKVVRGGSADVCELKSGDEILTINGADVTSHYMESIQSVISQAVAHGQLELRVRRLVKHSEDDFHEVFSDDEFEDSYRKKSAAQNHAIQLYSETSQTEQLVDDDEPPPLPSTAPPALDLTGVNSHQDDHFPSPPPHVRSASVVAVEIKSSTADVEVDNSREELLRKRIEFLGLKPEDSEEYRVMIEDKGHEGKSLPAHSSAFDADFKTSKSVEKSYTQNNTDSHYNGLVAGDYQRSYSQRDNIQVPITTDVINNADNYQRTNSPSVENSYSRRPTELRNNYDDYHRANSRSGENIHAPNNTDVKGDPADRQRNYNPTALGSYTQVNAESYPRLNSRIAAPEASLSQNEVTVGPSHIRDETVKEEIAWNRRSSERQSSMFHEPSNEVQQLKYKENYRKAMQEKDRNDNEMLKREKEKSIEEREQLRLQRYVAPGARPTNSSALASNNNVVSGVRPTNNAALGSNSNVASGVRPTNNAALGSNNNVVSGVKPTNNAAIGIGKSMTNGVETGYRTAAHSTISAEEMALPSNWASSSDDKSSQQNFAAKRQVFDTAAVVNPPPLNEQTRRQSSRLEQQPSVNSTRQSSRLEQQPSVNSTRQSLESGGQKDSEIARDAGSRQFSSGDELARQHYSDPAKRQYSGIDDPVRRQYSGIDDPVRRLYSGVDDQARRQYSGVDDPVRRQYSGVDDPARRQYSGVDDPVRRQYSGVGDQARRQYSGVDDPVRRQYSGVDDQARRQYSGVDDPVRRQYSGVDDPPSRQYSGVDDPARRQYSGVDEPVIHKYSNIGRQPTDVESEMYQRSTVGNSMDSFINKPVSGSQIGSQKRSPTGYDRQSEVITGYGNQPWQKDLVSTAHTDQRLQRQSSGNKNHQLLQADKQLSGSLAWSSSGNEGVPVGYRRPSTGKSEQPFPDYYPYNRTFTKPTGGQSAASANSSAVDTLFENAYRRRGGETRNSSVSGSSGNTLQGNRSSSASDLSELYRSQTSIDDGMGRLNKAEISSVGNLHALQQSLPVNSDWSRSLPPSSAGNLPVDHTAQPSSFELPGPNRQRLPSSSNDLFGGYRNQPTDSSVVHRMQPSSTDPSGSYRTQPFGLSAAYTAQSTSGDLAGANRTQPASSSTAYRTQAASSDLPVVYKTQPAGLSALFRTQPTSYDSSGVYGTQPVGLPVTYRSQATHADSLPSSSAAHLLGVSRVPPVETSLQPPKHFSSAMGPYAAGQYMEPSRGQSSSLPGHASYRTQTVNQFDEPSVVMAPRTRTLSASKNQMSEYAGQNAVQTQRDSYSSQPDLYTSLNVPPSAATIQSRVYQSRLAESAQHSRSSSNPIVMPRSEAVSSLFDYHTQPISGATPGDDDEYRYVPPSAAVQHITGMVSAPVKPPRVAGPTYDDRQRIYQDYQSNYQAYGADSPDQPRLYFESNDDVFCSMCQRPLYGSVVRMRNNQLICDNCDKSTTGRLKNSQL